MVIIKVRTLILILHSQRQRNGTLGSFQTSFPAGVVEWQFWRTDNAVVSFVQKTMPADTPDRLSAQESADVIAHMFAVSSIPAGDKELASDVNALASFVIEGPPKK